MSDLNDIQTFFRNCFLEHGTSAEGVGWNSTDAQEVRFEQLMKVTEPRGEPFSLIEFGCGYGHLIEYLRRVDCIPAQFYGYDIVAESLKAARERFADDATIHFEDNMNLLPVSDYLVASGVFNIKLAHDHASWTRHIIDSLEIFNKLTVKGFAVNFLTIYSDYERMAQRPDLYYADPSFLFDYCKNNFSRRVALLHDYPLYDFTLIVRKDQS